MSVVMSWRSTEMLLEVTVPSEARSSDARMFIVSVPLTRLRPLNCAAFTIDVIWSRNCPISVWIFSRSTFSSCAATILDLMSVRSEVIDSDALRATATELSPRDRLFLIALKPATSDSITFEIAQIAELSFAEAIVFPVEISFWVCPRFLLMPRRVCSAVMAPVFVRILVISFSSH